MTLSSIPTNNKKIKITKQVDHMWSFKIGSYSARNREPSGGHRLPSSLCGGCEDVVEAGTSLSSYREEGSRGMDLGNGRDRGKMGSDLDCR